MKFVKAVPVILIATVIALQFQECGGTTDIRVGFIGILSGRGSTISVAGCNGAVMAINEINGKGGIGGRRITLVLKDTGGTPAGAREALDYFNREGIDVVIGPMISGDAKVLIPEANRKRILLVSPTVSSDDFTGIDDYFVRCLPSVDDEANFLAGSAYTVFGMRTVTGLIDQYNLSYTESWYRSFRDRFIAIGGNCLPPVRARSGNIEYAKVARMLCAGSPDGIVLTAGAVEGAIICQHIRRIHFPVRIFIAGWAGADDFIINGGKSAEGVVCAHVTDHSSEKNELLSFFRAYESEYGEKATLAAITGYESAVMIISAFRKGARSADDVKRAILRQKTFHGLQDDFEIDRFGDGIRPFYLTIVKNRVFTRYQ